MKTSEEARLAIYLADKIKIYDTADGSGLILASDLYDLIREFSGK